MTAAGTCSGTPIACSEYSWTDSLYPDQQVAAQAQALPCFPGAPANEPCQPLEVVDAAMDTLSNWATARRMDCEASAGCELSYLCSQKADYESVSCDGNASQSECDTSGCLYDSSVCRLAEGFTQSTSCNELGTEMLCDEYSGDAGCRWGWCGGNKTTPCRNLNTEDDCSGRECFWDSSNVQCKPRSLAGDCRENYYNDLEDSYSTRKTRCENATCTFNEGCNVNRGLSARDSCEAIRKNEFADASYCEAQPDCNIDELCFKPACSALSDDDCEKASAACELQLTGGNRAEATECRGVATACDELRDEDSCNIQGCTWTSAD